MASESALLTRFLDEARNAFDEVLRFLQAEARQFADDLDDADFLVGRVFLEGDRELGLRLGSRQPQRRQRRHQQQQRPEQRR